MELDGSGICDGATCPFDSPNPPRDRWAGGNRNAGRDVMPCGPVVPIPVPAGIAVAGDRDRERERGGTPESVLRLPQSGTVYIYYTGEREREGGGPRSLC
ncbi:hypothetical protein KIPB_006393, partial [Kipferlia bialata]|eukprot:g6393.t1